MLHTDPYTSRSSALGFMGTLGEAWDFGTAITVVKKCEKKKYFSCLGLKTIYHIYVLVTSNYFQFSVCAYQQAMQERFVPCQRAMLYFFTTITKDDCNNNHYGPFRSYICHKYATKLQTKKRYCVFTPDMTADTKTLWFSDPSLSAICLCHLLVPESTRLYFFLWITGGRHQKSSTSYQALFLSGNAEVE